MLHYCPLIFYVGALISMCWKILFRLISLIVIYILSSILILNLILLEFLSNFFINEEIHKLNLREVVDLYYYDNFDLPSLKVAYRLFMSEFIFDVNKNYQNVDYKFKSLCYIFSFIYVYISYIIYIIVYWCVIILLFFKHLLKFDLLVFIVCSTDMLYLSFCQFYKDIEYNFYYTYNILYIKYLPLWLSEFIWRVFIVNIYVVINLIVHISIGLYYSFIFSSDIKMFSVKLEWIYRCEFYINLVKYFINSKFNISYVVKLIINDFVYLKHFLQGLISIISKIVFTKDHKVIGLCYIIVGVFCGLLGFWLSFSIRLELLVPGSYLFSGSGESYNSIVTSHGILMVFFAAMPILISGIGTYKIPILIGSKGFAIPILSNVSFILFVLSFILFLISSGIFGYSILGFEGGWTMYPPLSIMSNNPSIDWLIMSLYANGIASLLNAINTLVTIHCYSSIDKNHWSPFVWSILITSYLLILVLPVLVVCISCLLTDHSLGTSFFLVSSGGDPILFQHLFWFFGHPEVYILVIPAFGLISEIICENNGGYLVGKNVLIWSIVCIAILGCLVWGHHMYTIGMELDSKVYFTVATTFIGVPTGLKIFTWIGSLMNYKRKLTPPLLCAFLFIFSFVLGGFTGLVLAQSGLDLLLHDTYFVVGHFHYIMGIALLYAFFGYTYSKFYFFTGILYNEVLAKVHLITFFIGSQLLFAPMHFLGISGMPRRVFDYPSCFSVWNEVSFFGFIMVFISLLFFMASISPILFRSSWFKYTIKLLYELIYKKRLQDL